LFFLASFDSSGQSFESFSKIDAGNDPDGASVEWRLARLIEIVELEAKLAATGILEADILEMKIPRDPSAQQLAHPIPVEPSLASLRCPDKRDVPSPGKSDQTCAIRARKQRWVHFGSVGGRGESERWRRHLRGRHDHDDSELICCRRTETAVSTEIDQLREAVQAMKAEIASTASLDADQEDAIEAPF
jgi:hypothetical protein